MTGGGLLSNRVTLSLFDIVLRCGVLYSLGCYEREWRDTSMSHLGMGLHCVMLRKVTIETREILYLVEDSASSSRCSLKEE